MHCDIENRISLWCLYFVGLFLGFLFPKGEISLSDFKWLPLTLDPSADFKRNWAEPKQSRNEKVHGKKINSLK